MEKKHKSLSSRLVPPRVRERVERLREAELEDAKKADEIFDLVIQDECGKPLSVPGLKFSELMTLALSRKTTNEVELTITKALKKDGAYIVPDHEALTSDLLALVRFLRKKTERLVKVRW